jgi:hypothetical protein
MFKKAVCSSVGIWVSGRRGTRTPDIFCVREALYQLSYSPDFHAWIISVSDGKIKRYRRELPLLEQRREFLEIRTVIGRQPNPYNPLF